MQRRFAASAALLGLFLSSTIALAAQEKSPGYLGVLASKAEEGKSGAWIREVTPDSPAAKAGLRNGDLVIRVGDQEIKDAEDLTSVITGRKTGDQLALWIMRDGKEQKLEVTLRERPARQETQRRFGKLPIAPQGAFLGVHTQELTPELKERLGLAVDQGAMVTDVMPDAPAAKAGLKAEDVIVAVGGKDIASPAELRDAISSAKPGSEVALKVMRGKDKVECKATLAESPVAFDFGGLKEQLPELFKGRFEEGQLPFKFDLKDLKDGRFPMDVKQFTFDLNQLQNLQKKIEELEKRIAELEKQLRK